MTLDYLIFGSYVITMEGPGTGVIPNGAVGVSGNRIVVVGDADTVRKSYRAHREIDATGKAIMPGFVDAHMHTGDAIVRSCAQDLPGDIWRIRGILPLLGLANESDYVIGSRLNIIEALKSGTTTFGDFYNPMLSIADNYVDLGARACVSGMINELPRDIMQVELGQLIPLDSSVGNEKLTNNIRLVETCHQSHGGRITCRFGPHSTEYCSAEILREIKAQADHFGVGIFTHLSQTEEENFQTNLRNGCRPTELLDRLGYLGPKLLAAHMTYATMDEVRHVAQSGAALVLCSNSLCLVRGMVPPAQQFAEFGGLVALATDQANNCNFMFNEMKFSSLVHKFKNHDATQMPAWKVMRMATIDGAKALCMDDEIGSLRAGKKADLITIDLSYPHLNPIYDAPIRNLIPNLVYSARGHEVDMVMVDGRIVVEDHKLLTDDESRVVREANAAAKRIAQELAQVPWSKDLPLAKWTTEGYY